MTQLRSEAWLLRGISSIPGELKLRKDTLSFAAGGIGTAWRWQIEKLGRELGSPGVVTALQGEEQPVVFQWPTDDLTAWCPWYYFGGGIKVRRGGVTLRFSFGRPANTRVNVGSSWSPLALGQAAANLREVSAMRKRGKLWVAALGKPGRGVAPLNPSG